MALSQEHRRSITRSLAPILGEEEAEAMVAEFPAREEDRPASKADLELVAVAAREQLAEFRGETRAEFEKLRGEMSTEFEKVRGEMSTEFSKVRGEMAGLRGEMSTEFEKVRGEMTGLRGEMSTELSKVRGELTGIRGEMTAGFAQARTDFAERMVILEEKFESQTRWVLATMLAVITLATTISALLR